MYSLNFGRLGRKIQIGHRSSKKLKYTPSLRTDPSLNRSVRPVHRSVLEGPSHPFRTNPICALPEQETKYRVGQNYSRMFVFSLLHWPNPISLNRTFLLAKSLFLHHPVERGSDYWEGRDGRKVTFSSGVDLSSFFALSGGGLLWCEGSVTSLWHGYLLRFWRASFLARYRLHNHDNSLDSYQRVHEVHVGQYTGWPMCLCNKFSANSSVTVSVTRILTEILKGIIFRTLPFTQSWQQSRFLSEGAWSICKSVYRMTNVFV